MKSALLTILALTGSLLASEEPKEWKPYPYKYDSLVVEISGYSPAESPWKDDREKSALEWHLYSLMRVDVRLWGLQDYLKTKREEAYYPADQADQIVHGELLSYADKALTALKGSPNPAFTRLLIKVLESYPYDWVEEGWENLLPGLRELLAVPSKQAGPKKNGNEQRNN